MAPIIIMLIHIIHVPESKIGLRPHLSKKVTVTRVPRNPKAPTPHVATKDDDTLERPALLKTVGEK
jgi:hypothetical protein